MLAVMIVPTGIGAEIGGHSGDATSAAHLLAECCDQLILHPNVVNASDFTEQPANSLYVEGSMLDTFLSGDILLKPVRRNHILVVINEENRETINAVNAMRSLLGVSAEVLILPTPLKMRGFLDQDRGLAAGEIEGVDELIDAVDEYEYDTLAIHTPVDVETAVAAHYVQNGGLNPWGGVEAMLSKEVYWRTGKPNAHAPIEGHTDYEYNQADPRLAPEMICAAHLGSVLRGLHKAPQPTIDATQGQFSVRDVDVMISPLCWGAPHKMCRERGIEIIFVEENMTQQMAAFVDNATPDDGFVVNNYLEAAGAMMQMKSGRTLASVLRPLDSVTVHGKG